MLLACLLHAQLVLFSILFCTFVLVMCESCGVGLDFVAEIMNGVVTTFVFGVMSHVCS